MFQQCILFVGPSCAAILDLVVTILEIIVVAYIGPYIALLVLLVTAAICRVATIWVSPDRFWRQKIDFLGGETTNEVVGEHLSIIVLRATIVGAIMLALPVFTVYSIIWVPLQTQVHTSIIAPSSASPLWDFEDRGAMRISFRGNVSTSVTTSGPSPWGSPLVCSPAPFDGQYTIVSCDLGWEALALNDSPLSIALNFTPDTGSIIYVTPGQGDNTDDILQYTDPIPVPSGTQLFAVLSWTRRQIYTTASSRLLGPFASSYNPTKFLQDAAATPLDGISAVGGVWTFVNATFVLFFGANFMYFAFGRRPLSALGILHLFQRRALTRRWHEDFPALQTEGGQPGSESAGIVAFIRERLVDIDSVEEDPEKQDRTGDAESHKLTAENSDTESQSITSPTKSKGPEGGGLRYQLDEIPLTHFETELGSWVEQPDRDQAAQLGETSGSYVVKNKPNPDSIVCVSTSKQD
ncbi:hypothetical protein DFH06DRAFT_1324771 [Mycena polygramma]|nr:hypothetical protein DFH06DRAFT_1324771 [Mycena polygramma]